MAQSKQFWHFLTIIVAQNYKAQISSLMPQSIHPLRFSITEDQYEHYYKSLGLCFLAAGDYNAKHTFWGSRPQKVVHCIIQFVKWA